MVSCSKWKQFNISGEFGEVGDFWPVSQFEYFHTSKKSPPSPANREKYVVAKKYKNKEMR